MAKGLIVILSDEHRADALSCAGHDFVQTPHLDALAARGTRFTQSYTPSPICVPARAAFATGRHVHETRHWDNAMPYTGSPESWGHVLQRSGVQVESIGKLHYRDAGDDVGFDAMHIPMMVKDGVGMVFASLRRETERVRMENRMLGPRIGAGESDYTRYDRAVVARTKDWLAEKAQAQDARPWCLYVGLVAPHFPLICPEPFFSRYREMDLPEPKQTLASGYTRHPWVEKQNAFMDTESKFASPEERRDAMAAYWGLCSFLDHNIGEILGALEASGLEADVIYSSDHGDNVGARGLWGKSNMYNESVQVPLIAAVDGIPPGTVDTPVSLLDLAESIPAFFGLVWDGQRPGTPLQDIAAAPADPAREVISQYHAAGAVSGAYMLRSGRWKYIEFVGFAPELFDLHADPEELENLAPTRPDDVAKLAAQLRRHVDPEAQDAHAFADQDALIARFGGPEKAAGFGARGATPPPETS
ncbi:MAG: sulfatase-like hydrolase/transferase [Pseudomonadota bacterium]